MINGSVEVCSLEHIHSAVFGAGVGERELAKQFDFIQFFSSQYFPNPPAFSPCFPHLHVET